MRVMEIMVPATPLMKAPSPANCATSIGIARVCTVRARCVCTR